MTIKATLAAIRAQGAKASYNRATGEYRVTLQRQWIRDEEAMAYYTNDADDAIGTANAMIATNKHERLHNR